MSGAVKSNLYYFPVDKVMSRRVAEERLGNIKQFGYPKFKGDTVPQHWLEAFLMNKSVLLGWQAIREGVVDSFKLGRVRHLVSDVATVDIGKKARPLVKVLCAKSDYPVFNWASGPSITKTPVAILTVEQSSHFRMCERCQAAMEKQRRDALLARHKRAQR